MENNVSSAKACYLVLEDGSILTGETFGAEKPVDGEVGKKRATCGCFFKTLYYCFKLIIS